MTRFLLRRLGLLLLTLWLMSVIVFVISTILPGDVASAVLGRDATPQAGANLRHEWGLDYPPPVVYLRWITGFVTGQWGYSRSFGAPIADLIPGRLGNSLLLAAAALVVIVPLSIALGTVAALRQDRLSDRAISIAGLSLMAVPEFVSGIILLTVFGIWLHVLPTGSISSGGGPLTSPAKLAASPPPPGLFLFWLLP